MNCLDLKNNALFLSCWYERTRPVQLICIGILILGSIFLGFLSASLHQTQLSAVCLSLFNTIVIVQALVLLVQGTMLAGQMAARERTGETLDFHRNSPQPVGHKVIGLIFGSTCVEWGIFCILFVLELFFTVLPEVRILQVVTFNVSLIMTGVLFHSIAVMAALSSANKKRINPIFLLLLFLFFGVPILGAFLLATSCTFFSHVSGVTAFQAILPGLWHVPSAPHFNGHFYILDFPLIVMQAIVQIPLLLLVIKGITRLFCLPNSLAWSKADVMRFCGFILFVVTGFFVANYMHIDELFKASAYFTFYSDGSMKSFLNRFIWSEISLFTSLFVMAGGLISFFCVPTYFRCSKYLMLNKSFGIAGKVMADDGATGMLTVLVYVGMGGLFILPYVMVVHCSLLSGISYFLIISSHIMAFAGFLEFFRLSRWRNKRIFILTALLIWWVFLPWMMALMMNFRLNEHVSMATISPFMALPYAASLLLEQKQFEFIAVMAPCIVAGVMSFLAYETRRAMALHILGDKKLDV